MKVEDRRGDCTESDATLLESIEIHFALPIFLTQEEQVALHELVRDITSKPYNQSTLGHHWPSFVGSRLNYSRIDAALLGKTPGPNPPPDGEEPEADDSVLVFETAFREFRDEDERAKELGKAPRKKFEHVDDFIDNPFADKYARWILLHMRQPAHGMHYQEFIEGRRLFCTMGGDRFRVTMASRMGHIGLATDFEREAGYDVTAYTSECTDWGREP